MSHVAASGTQKRKIERVERLSAVGFIDVGVTPGVA
jgi:hypothetical protein